MSGDAWTAAVIEARDDDNGVVSVTDWVANGVDIAHGFAAGSVLGAITGSADGASFTKLTSVVSSDYNEGVDVAFSYSLEGFQSVVSDTMTIPATPTLAGNLIVSATNQVLPDDTSAIRYTVEVIAKTLDYFALLDTPTIMSLNVNDELSASFSVDSFETNTANGYLWRMYVVRFEASEGISFESLSGRAVQLSASSPGWATEIRYFTLPQPTVAANVGNLVFDLLKPLEADGTGTIRYTVDVAAMDAAYTGMIDAPTSLSVVTDSGIANYFSITDSSIYYIDGIRRHTYSFEFADANGIAISSLTGHNVILTASSAGWKDGARGFIL